MRVQEKKTKGFTILELIVVIAIISIISAAAYPGFTSWMKGRQATAGIVKIQDLFTTINTQVQRGTYPFVQVYIQHLENLKDISYPDGIIKVTTKGMGQKKLAQKRYNDNEWKNRPYERCKIENTESPVYWDNDNINSFTSEKITVNIKFKSDAAICFSKDGRYYSVTGAFEIEFPFFYICGRSSTNKSCNMNGNAPPDDAPGVGLDIVFKIKWSRFANITLDKWSDTLKEDGDPIGWVLQ